MVSMTFDMLVIDITCTREEVNFLEISAFSAENAYFKTSQRNAKSALHSVSLFQNTGPLNQKCHHVYWKVVCFMSMASNLLLNYLHNARRELILRSKGMLGPRS